MAVVSDQHRDLLKKLSSSPITVKPPWKQAVLVEPQSSIDPLVTPGQQIYNESADTFLAELMSMPIPTDRLIRQKVMLRQAYLWLVEQNMSWWNLTEREDILRTDVYLLTQSQLDKWVEVSLEESTFDLHSFSIMTEAQWRNVIKAVCKSVIYKLDYSMRIVAGPPGGEANMDVLLNS